MLIPPHAELHFRTRFYLPLEPAEAPSTARRLQDAIRDWALERFPDGADELGAERFAAGRSHWISIARHGVVRTSRLDDPEPGGRIWAFQARLPDPEVRSRQWAHQVAVGPLAAAGLRVSGRVHHWLEVGELGWHPPQPPAGPPAWALAVAAVSGEPVTDGHAPLPLEPQAVRPGDGPDFVRRLADPGRRVPVVYLSLPGPEAAPLLDPGALARAVALEAAVHVARSPELDAELDHFLSPPLRCYGGALRIYRPGLDPGGGRREGERHRYIPRGRLASRPPAELVAEVAAEVVQGVALEDPREEPVTFDELEALRGRRELAALRAETEALRRRSRGGLSAEDARRLFEVNERLERRIASLEEDNARLARRSFYATEELAGQREAAGGSAVPPPDADEVDVAALVEALRELPSTPAEALELAACLFPRRLHVTGRARSAAAEALTDDTAMAWRMLVAMAEDLHPLHFGEGAEARSPLEIREAFRDRTRFDVAFTESKSTKAAARLRALRTLHWDGEDVELLWHVKWGSRPPKLLRAYYHPDPKRRLLVVDWFGDHLETAGTRRM